MLRVHELTKRFHSGGSDVLAVDHVSFDVPAGEVYGLMGPNGAGKTTTLRMVLGLLPPDSGYAELDGYRTTDALDQIKARVGIVSASDGIYPWLTVREMLLFFADLYAVPPAEARRSVDRLSNMLGMASFLDRRAASLSTGQRQRSVLARGMIHNPPVMLLDEPTRGLDVVGSQVVFDYITYLRDQGKAVILSTHRLDEAQRVCDRFGLLHQARLRHEGTLAELQRITNCQSLVQMFHLLIGEELDGGGPAAEHV